MADRGGAELSTWRTANGGRGGSGTRQTGSGGRGEALGSVELIGAVLQRRLDGGPRARRRRGSDRPIAELGRGARDGPGASERRRRGPGKELVAAQRERKKKVGWAEERRRKRGFGPG